jgi:TolB-like protein/DNA-binding winged helix-turn-helix (wHTH) protein/Flp pilus assembly protein TadD
VSEATSIRIGPWIARPALNLLERGTRSVRIEPRAMDVLVFLAGRDGAVASVDELIASVWKGVIVGDGSVYLAISQLRQALGDSDQGTRYIETTPKRGYRLAVPVERVERVEPERIEPQRIEPGRLEPGRLSAPATPVAPHEPATAARRAPPLRRWLAAALCGVVVAIVAIYAVSPGTGSRRAATASVAVLPFANLSSDPEQQYFADGTTLELLNALSRVRDLRVTGRASSFQFKGGNDDLRAIGETLGVEHLLQGSVRRSRDRVRITVQLSHASTGDRLWSRSYERRLDDVFLIQDEIARSVADALQITLGVGDVGRAPGMTSRVDAYDEYLRGMALNLEWQPESFLLAVAHLQRAVALDPSFSMAWAGLCAVYANGAFALPDRAGEWRQQATHALDQARALTPDAPYVLLETGIAETRRQRWLDAAAAFDRLQASYARYGIVNQAWGPRGVFLLGVGRVREAIPALERARAEEPLAPAFAGFLGAANLANGDLAGTFAEIDRGLTLEGLDMPLRKAGLFAALTRGDRAVIDKRLGAIADTSPEGRVSRRLARFLDAPAGAAAEIRLLASTANPFEKAMLAQWAAFYHEPELSLQLLADAAPNLSHPAVLWQPLLRETRKLPAFKNLVRNLGFVDYWRVHGWSDFCHPLNGDDFACE